MSVKNGDVIRATAVLQGGDSQQICNVYYYEAQIETDETDDIVMQSIRDHLEDNIYTAINSKIDNACTYIEVMFYNITQDVPMGSKLWDTLTTGGASTETGLPSGTAACITGGTFTKNVKPKKFYGVFTEMSNADGQWNNDLMLQLADAAAQWLERAAVIYGDMVPGTWSKVLLKFVPLVSAVVRSVVAYQRRRKAAVGS